MDETYLIYLNVINLKCKRFNQEDIGLISVKRSLL